MMTLDQLDTRINEILDDFLNSNQPSDLKKIYEEIKNEIPTFIKIDDTQFVSNLDKTADDILCHYAIHLYQQYLKGDGEFIEEKQKIHAYLYEKNWSEFFQMVQLEHVENATTRHVAMGAPRKVIYNLEGYDNEVDILPPSNSEQGSPLMLSPSIPIGYIINLPESEVKGVLVKVYGGLEKEDRKEKLFKPGELHSEDKALLSNGIAVVYLNLVDLIKLEVYQNLMPQWIHAELHQSINKFWETIHYAPENLAQELFVLKNKPIILSGSSWGGRTAIRHAELYSGTFDRYISFDGSISAEMNKKSDKSLVGARPSNLEHLDPALYIKDMQDPILLVHNVNDNNVNLKVSLDFYDKAKKEGKENLLSVHINNKGDRDQRGIGVWSTGHSMPNINSSEFESLVNSVSNFIIFGPDKIPELTAWRTLKYNSISDRNYNLASAGELFIEYINRTYGKKLPDSEMLSRIFSIFEFMKRESADSIRAVFGNPPSNEELAYGLRLILPEINSYFKDKYDAAFDGVLISPEILRAYQRSVWSADEELHRELLLTFILANPKYVNIIYNYISSKSDFESLKDEVFLKLIKQRASFHLASKVTLSRMIEQGIIYERETENQIKNGDIKAFRTLIMNYNSSGGVEALARRLKGIFSDVAEDNKKAIINKMIDELIFDLSIRDEILVSIRDMITLEDYEIILKNAKSRLDTMMSRLVGGREIDRFIHLTKIVNPQLKRELINLNILKHIKTSEKLIELCDDLSDEDVYELFARVEGKEMPLSWSHDISYLLYLKKRVGEDKFKKLLEIDLGGGLKGSILNSYLSSNDIESFKFLVNYLTTDELLEHIKNSKNNSYYSDNLVLNTIANGRLEHFEVIATKLEFDGKAEEINRFILEKDRENDSAIKYAINSNSDTDLNNELLLKRVLDFCTPANLATELKSEDVHFLGILEKASCNNQEASRELIKSKLGEPLFKEIIEAKSKEIILAMLRRGNIQFEQDIIKFLGEEKVTQCLDENLDNILSSHRIDKSSFDLIRKYSSSKDLGEKIAKYCSESLKEKMNSGWSYTLGDISKILHCLEPEEYVAFQKHLLSGPNDFSSYFTFEGIQKTEKYFEKIKELISAPDEMLPYLFSFKIISLALVSKNPFIDIALKDANKGPNSLFFRDVLTKSNDVFVNFIMSPTALSLSKALFLRNEFQQNSIVNLISFLSHEDKKNLISVEVLKNIHQGATLSKLLDDFSDEEVFALFTRVEGKETALTSNHDVSYLRYLKERVGEGKFKELLEIDLGKGLKGSILNSYLSGNDIESFKFLVNYLATDELLEHIQNSKNNSFYVDNLILNTVANGRVEQFEVIATKLEHDGKTEEVKRFILETDRKNFSGIKYVIDLNADSGSNLSDERLLKRVLDFFSPSELVAELKSEDVHFLGILEKASCNNQVASRELIKSKLGETLFKEIIEAKSKEIILAMIRRGNIQFEQDIIKLLGKEKVTQYLDENLDDILSSYSIDKSSFDLIRKYSSSKNLGEKIAKCCSDSLKEKMNSGWSYALGDISKILRCLEPEEYPEFQKQLLSEPNDFASYFTFERIQKTERYFEKIKELISVSDEMVPIIFNDSVLKTIFTERLQDLILSLYQFESELPKNLSTLLDLLYLTKTNQHFVDCILYPSSDALKYLIDARVMPQTEDAFRFCWKNLFNQLDTKQIKQSLTLEVLSHISDEKMLLDAFKKLTESDVFELFDQPGCKEMLKNYSDSMLKVIAESVGEKNYRVLLQDNIEGNVESRRVLPVMSKEITEDMSVKVRKHKDEDEKHVSEKKELPRIKK